MQKYCVRFEQVKKSYDGKVLIVKNLNLVISKGEFITMLGPSGSGKTTCLMLIAGFEDITQGEIYINDLAIKETVPYKRNIGMVFQNYALFPHMTVEQNLAYPLKFRKFNKKQAQKQVEKYLELVELQDFAKRYPSQLSGGQKQRVALARAMVYEPEIILMDEPLAALDKNLREQMQYEIKHLHELLKFTVIYVTHDQTEALIMSDRIAIFNHGIIQQIDSPKKIYEEPKNKFVAEFIGENNHLEGELEKIKDDTAYIKVGKETILARVNEINAQDRNVFLSIRPEKVVLSALSHESEKKQDNEFNGTINKVIYIGDHIRIYVNFLDGLGNFIVKQPNYANAIEYNKGDNVKISWLAKDCQALKV